MHYPTIPLALQLLSPRSMIWRMKSSRKDVIKNDNNKILSSKPEDFKIYLTFDDGPVPEVTPKVLEILKRYNAKATFFCVGDNVRKYPEIYEMLLKEGHATGNHTYSHLNGIKTNNLNYFDDIKKARELVDSDLFRPPYGRITYRQVKEIEKEYKIVMWSVLTGDYDHSLTKEAVLENAIRHGKDGSIIAFHDSIKAYDRMIYALPEVLEHFTHKGYVFEKIDL